MVYSADKALGHERFGLVAAIFALQVDDNWFAIPGKLTAMNALKSYRSVSQDGFA